MFGEITVPITLAGKALFYLLFAVLIGGLLLTAYCEFHKSPPVIHILPTPPPEPDIVPQVLLDQNNATQEVQQETIKTADVVQQVVTKTHKAVAVIKANTALTVPDQTKQIGEAQISNLESLYNQYYPSSATPGSTSAPASSGLTHSPPSAVKVPTTSYLAPVTSTVLMA